MPPGGPSPDPAEEPGTGVHPGRLKAVDAKKRAGIAVGKAGDRIAASTRDRPLVLVGAAALAGLALGWAIVPIVAPAPWAASRRAAAGGESTASGARVVAVDLGDYAALVAEADARRPDPALAAARLAIADPALSTEALARVADTHPDAAVASAAARLATGAAAGGQADASRDGAAAGGQAGASGDGAAVGLGTAAPLDGPSRWARAVAVGLLAGAAAFAVQSWRARRPPSYRSRARLASQARPWSGAEPPQSGDVGHSPTSGMAASATANPLAAADNSTPRPVASGPTSLPVAAAGGMATGPAGSMATGPAAGSASGPWQTEPMILGRTVQTRYLGPDPRFQRTWLIHDAAGGLVGGAGLRPRRVGDAELVELWCFDRADQLEAEPAPVLVLTTPRAEDTATNQEDSPSTGVLVARSGATAILRSMRVQLAVRVAEATLDESALGFRSLTLDMRPELRGG